MGNSQGKRIENSRHRGWSKSKNNSNGGGHGKPLDFVEQTRVGEALEVSRGGGGSALLAPGEVCRLRLWDATDRGREARE